MSFSQRPAHCEPGEVIKAESAGWKTHARLVSPCAQSRLPMLASPSVRETAKMPWYSLFGSYQATENWRGQFCDPQTGIRLFSVATPGQNHSLTPELPTYQDSTFLAHRYLPKESVDSVGQSSSAVPEVGGSRPNAVIFRWSASGCASLHAKPYQPAPPTKLAGTTDRANRHRPE